MIPLSVDIGLVPLVAPVSVHLHFPIVVEACSITGDDLGGLVRVISGIWEAILATNGQTRSGRKATEKIPDSDDHQPRGEGGGLGFFHNPGGRRPPPGLSTRPVLSSDEGIRG